MKKRSSKEIIVFLEKNLLYSYDTPRIYQKLNGKIPINTIRSELKRLYDSGRIRRVGRGFYQALVKQENIDLLENPPTMLHAITIVCVSPKLQKLRQGLTASNCRFSCWMDFLEWIEKEDFKTNNYSKGDKKQYSKRIWFDDRDVQINIHNN